MKPIRVYLTDDHDLMRMGLSALLDTCDDISVIGDASNGDATIRDVLKLKPDVIIMDLMMPHMDGIETTRKLIAEWPEANVLILTTFSLSDGINSALQAGAKGAVLKNTDLNGLHEAILTVSKGKQHLSPEITQIMTTDPPVAILTSRQQAILSSAVRGFSNADIAKEFGISRMTVKAHLKVIFQKLGAANRTEAAAIAERKHLLKM